MYTIAITYDSSIAEKSLQRFWRYVESRTYATLGDYRSKASFRRCLFAISSKSQEFESRRTSVGAKTRASILFERIDAYVIYEKTRILGLAFQTREPDGINWPAKHRLYADDLVRWSYVILVSRLLPIMVILVPDIYSWIIRAPLKFEY